MVVLRGVFLVSLGGVVSIRKSIRKLTGLPRIMHVQKYINITI